MRFAFFLLPTLLVSAQTYTYDSDGRKVELASFSERRELRVIEDGPNGKIVEEIVRRKDAQGTPMPLQRIRNIERKGPSGESIQETLSYEADINGHMSLQEKTTIVTRAEGQLTRTETNVEKANINGGLQLFEKVTAETRKENGKEVVNRAIYRTDATGQLAENAREAIERVSKDGKTEETVSTFESASTGKLIMSRQATTVSLKNPDGSSSSVVTIYGVDAPGRPAGGALKVREQQIRETKAGPGNTLVESLSIRRPDLADGRLGKEIKVAERVFEAPKAAKP